ncbi:MAG: hypothetical protein PHS92_04480 [Candidatus Gracilibacteria bacterium]|nr:hypothetical protein [Candidatus Gracilibacteria bacterium]
MENLNSSIENLNDAVDNMSNPIGQNGARQASVKSSNAYFIASIIIFAFSILATVFLYLSNVSTDGKISETNSKISEFRQTIDDLKNNNQIVAYNIIKDALPNIEKSINESKVQNYVNELAKISRKYKIDYSGFSYSNKKITTSAISAGGNNIDGIQKVSEFIKDYRTTPNNNIFTLDPVSSITGNSAQRSFQINLTVK